jgi:hypothetical protein
MTMFNREIQSVYLAEPHTASRAVKRALLKQGGWEYFKPHHASIADLLETNQITVNELTWRFLVTLRNPLDVLVTQWRYSSFQKGTFAAYLGEMKGKPEIEFPMRGYWKDATHFLYYEHLSEDWRYFFPKGPPLEHIVTDRTDRKGHWSDHYKDIPSWVEYLLDRYSSFCHTFGYRIDPMSKQSCWIDETLRFRRRGLFNV